MKDRLGGALAEADDRGDLFRRGRWRWRRRREHGRAVQVAAALGGRGRRVRAPLRLVLVQLADEALPLCLGLGVTQRHARRARQLLDELAGHLVHDEEGGKAEAIAPAQLTGVLGPVGVRLAELVDDAVPDTAFWL